MGSLMQPYGGGEYEERSYGEPRPPKQMREQAADFMEQYFTSLKKQVEGIVFFLIMGAGAKELGKKWETKIPTPHAKFNEI